MAEAAQAKEAAKQAEQATAKASDAFWDCEEKRYSQYQARAEQEEQEAESDWVEFVATVGQQWLDQRAAARAAREEPEEGG
eukprot:11710747-Alexandrium_andersonii.AAC.1